MPSSTHPPPSSAKGARVRRAVIDVGTNSVKLLVADVSADSVQPLDERSEITRLGRGFYEDHHLRPVAIADTAAAVGHFVSLARRHGVPEPRIIATSAVREAKNRDELLTAIQTSSGLGVEVITGAQEADLAFRGVTSDPKLAGQALLILDVGGGSTEIILGRDQSSSFRDSYQLGVVRLLEKFVLADPPADGDLPRTRAWLRQFIREKIRPALDPALQALGKQPLLVGTGGTAAILSRLEQQRDDYDRARIESILLARATVRSWTERLWSLPLAGRRQIVGLPPNRADVILMGAVIFETVMEEFGFEALRPSMRGLRFGAVLEGA